MVINLIRFDCMKWPFEMTVYWTVEMIICWGVEMIICWNVENVLWCWLTVSISEAFRCDCICCVRYENDFDWNVDDWCLFLMKIWSNECVWRPINGPRWRKKMIKWMWCCYRAMRQTSCWCQKCLHLMSMSSDALAVECDVRTAAFDRETIRCTLTIVCWWSCQSCIWCRCHQMHWRLSEKIVRRLHLMLISSNVLTIVWLPAI